MVCAKEYSEITDDIEIRYRWYKEIITGDYYPSKDIKEGDKIIFNKVRYGNYSEWAKEHCSLSPKNYALSTRKINIYRKLLDTRTVLIENINDNADIKIYYQNEKLNFQKINLQENKIKINLEKSCLTDSLIFFVDNDDNYKISLYMDATLLNKIVSKEIKNEKIVSVDESWVDERTIFSELYTESTIKEGELTKRIATGDECRYREIYVYKYNIEREYYDDNYYLNVDGYIKDIDDYKIYYKGEPIINTIEIIKPQVIKEKELEYVYVEKDTDDRNNDSSQDNDFKIDDSCPPNIVKTEIVEKKVFKVPKKIYLIIILLLVIITFLIVKLSKKICRLKKIEGIVEKL